MPTSPSHLHTLHQSMIELLGQCLDLCESLTDAQYTAKPEQVGASPVGGHVRHSLEHFLPLLDPDTGDLIDYDARERERRLETDRAYAAAETRTLLDAARNLDPASLDRTVAVRSSVSSDPVSPVVDSSLAREVMFAVVHAIHHFAIIRILCDLQGIALPDTFGVAPSTLHHQRTAARA